MELTTPTVQLPALTSDEDSFCLALVEYGGNLPAAYNAVYASEDAEGKLIPIRNAGMKARELISRPEIAQRVAHLQAHVQEHAFISLGSHLDQMARLRDLAATAGDFKAAISAEKARGEVAGYYVGKDPKAGSGEGNGKPSVTIVMNNTPASVEAWAQQHGQAPVILEIPK